MLQIDICRAKMMIFYRNKLIVNIKTTTFVLSSYSISVVCDEF